MTNDELKPISSLLGLPPFIAEERIRVERAIQAEFRFMLPYFSLIPDGFLHFGRKGKKGGRKMAAIIWG